jgi:hypothetical protein
MENDHPSLPVLYDAKWKFDYVYLNVYDLTPVNGYVFYVYDLAPILDNK